MLGGPETGGGSGGVDPDSTNLIAFDPGDIGLPDGGSVTLTISGDVDYDETAEVSEDGMVYFLIPAMRVGSEITVKIMRDLVSGDLGNGLGSVLVIQFGLGLSFKSRIRMLDGNNRSHPVSYVRTGKVLIFIL